MRGAGTKKGPRHRPWKATGAHTQEPLSRLPTLKGYQLSYGPKKSFRSKDGKSGHVVASRSHNGRRKRWRALWRDEMGNAHDLGTYNDRASAVARLREEGFD